MIQMPGMNSAQADPDNAVAGKFHREILVGSGLVFGAGLYLHMRVQIPDTASLDRQQVLCLDRWALQYQMKSAATLSDIGLILCNALPLFAMMINHDKVDIENEMLRFVHSQCLAIGFCHMAKGLVRRPRPYAYHPEDFGITSLDADAARSFYSGHTTLAFSAACVAGVGMRRSGNEKWTTPVWIAGLSSASLTGLFRVLSGRHFPTDVLVGAATGVLVGLLIPEIYP